MERGGQKIVCPSCRQESAVKIIKKYDGFTPVGEVRTCAFCGYEFDEEDPAVIRDRPPEWTREEELKKVCHRCRHYVVNPFIQKCVLRQKEVEATDTCADFKPRPAPLPEPKKKEEPPPSLLGPPPPTPTL